MRRAVAAFVMASLGVAAVGLACTSIPEPAGRPLDAAAPSDAAVEASDTGPGADASRCRGGGWRSLTGPGVLLLTDSPGVAVLAGSGVFSGVGGKKKTVNVPPARSPLRRGRRRGPSVRERRHRVDEPRSRSGRGPLVR